MSGVQETTVEDAAQAAVEAAERGDHRSAVIGLAEIVVALAEEIAVLREEESPDADGRAFQERQERRARRRALGAQE